MSRKTLPAIIIAAITLLAGGWILGLALDPAAVFGLKRPGAEEDAGHDAHDDEHEGHVHLSEAAFKSLSLRIRPVKLSDGKHSIQVPGEIVEKPGYSDHALAAPVNGVVTEVFALPGQAIRPGDPLFKLQVIDEALATAQLNLLNAIARLTTLEAELKRISPLADAGTVLGRKKLELEYEQNELNLKKQLYEQELEVRGLTDDQVAKIKTDKRLIREFVVGMPADIGHAGLPALRPPEEGATPLTPTDGQPVRPVSSTTMGDDWEYTVEELKVFPGKSVERGDDLCHVAYHTTLYIRGEIFESELDAVLTLGEGEKQDWTVTAVFGAHDGADVAEGLTVHYVDNHVNTQTQTYMFYLPIRNGVVRDSVDDDGRRFRTWRFKPGQRVHLEIPVQPYAKKIRLPPGAVVTEGANAYVFREVVEGTTQHDGHSHAASSTEDDHGHSHGGTGEVAIDLERVPVEIEYRSSKYILLAADGQLKPGDDIAMNHAYQLYLELKSQSGGADAGHGHEH